MGGLCSTILGYAAISLLVSIFKFGRMVFLTRAGNFQIEYSEITVVRLVFQLLTQLQEKFFFLYVRILCIFYCEKYILLNLKKKRLT